ncbi:Imm1 family immunity protein [Actinosynnema sp. CA-248983]
MIVTASLTTGIACVTTGRHACIRLVDTVLGTAHHDWETTMSVGDEEFRRTKDGPFPNHQLRISVDPGCGYAAINYTDHDDPHMPNANSFNAGGTPADVTLIFNGSTGAVFPRESAIPVADARRALVEWLDTRKRPTCIEWRPYGHR